MSHPSPSFARVIAGTLHGLRGLRVQVEVDLARDLPGFSLVGLPSAATRESRERVGAALRHAGFLWPDRHITVNLAPADRRKDGAVLDLAIAAGILLASDQVRPRPSPVALGRVLLAGELALDGSVRPTRGLLALGLDAARLGVDGLIVPQAQLEELDAVASLRRVGLTHLSRLPDALHRVVNDCERAPIRAPAPPSPATGGLDSIKGQDHAKFALKVAAAGGHHVLLSGPPGCGKTLLARQLVQLLPALTDAERVERLRVGSCAGLAPDLSTAGRPPLRAPHHSVSPAGLIGGGRPPVPGEITLAHHGVLFLDELAEFSGPTLDRLREPLSSGWIQLSRLGDTLRYPARFQLIAATNLCPCGYKDSLARKCQCLPYQIARYRRRLSGPLRDRIDLYVGMDREPAGRWWERGPSTEDAWRAHVVSARDAARSRGVLNAQLDGDALHTACALDDRAAEYLRRWADDKGESLRALTGSLRVGRTIADLEGKQTVGVEEIAQALSYRRDRETDASRGPHG